MTALVGHSGSGKSTILNLIPRFYQLLQSGDIKIDNQSIYEVKITLTSKKYFTSQSRNYSYLMILLKTILNMQMKMQLMKKF